MSDQKNPNPGRTGKDSPSRSGNTPERSVEKGAYTGEPLQTNQQIPPASQVNVPVRTYRSTQDEK
jgi:hypothetical protein